MDPKITHPEAFKEELDKYLNTIPDNSGTQSNSLLNLETRHDNKSS